MWPQVVVVGGEGVDLRLEGLDRLRRLLLCEIALERLVEPLDFPARLGMVGA